jgi:hypothetical protein
MERGAGKESASVSFSTGPPGSAQPGRPSPAGGVAAARQQAMARANHARDDQSSVRLRR